MELATITVQGEVTHLRYQRVLWHAPERVWEALTDPKKLEAWLGAVELDPSVGGEVVIHWLNGDAVARGPVTAFDPPRMLEYETDIHGRLRWGLAPFEDGTLMVFTVDNTVPDEWLSKNVAGWHIHLDFLEEALDGERVDWPNWPLDRWEDIHARYLRAHQGSRQQSS